MKSMTARVDLGTRISAWNYDVDESQSEDDRDASVQLNSNHLRNGDSHTHQKFRETEEDETEDNDVDQAVRRMLHNLIRRSYDPHENEEYMEILIENERWRPISDIG